MFGFKFEALFVAVGLEDSLNDSILRDVAEGARKHLRIHYSFFFEGMIVWAGSFLASIGLTAQCLIV